MWKNFYQIRLKEVYKNVSLTNNILNLILILILNPNLNNVLNVQLLFLYIH